MTTTTRRRSSLQPWSTVVKQRPLTQSTVRSADNVTRALPQLSSALLLTATRLKRQSNNDQQEAAKLAARYSLKRGLDGELEPDDNNDGSPIFWAKEPPSFFSLPA